VSRRSQQRRGSIPLAGEVSGGANRHGLTTLQIEAMRRDQRGACAVCGAPLPLVPLVDHDHRLARLHGHRTDRGCARCVRALLCNPCNLMIGNARELPRVLRAGAAYLERWVSLESRR
jgi:hypothetical protein